MRATALPLARYGLRGAVAARFWIYQRREPVSLVYWCITGVIMIAASVSSLIGSQRHLAVMFLSAILGVAFVGVFHANSVGGTGPAFVVEAAALTDRSALRAYLSGRNIALAVIGIPLLAALSFGLAALAGSPGPRCRGETAGTLPGRYPQPAINRLSANHHLKEGPGCAPSRHGLVIRRTSSICATEVSRF